jgi:hypothetical protein
MSSYSGGGFEEWLEDSIFRDAITEECWRNLVALLEPHRDMIDGLCDDYDEEIQGWREYRNALWSLIPEDINKRVTEILKAGSIVIAKTMPSE